MTAPALILLAHGSTEPHQNAALHQLRVQMQQARPELNVNLAFIDRCPPSGPAVVQALASRGVREMVFVPLDLTHAVEADEQAHELLQRVRIAHPEIAFTMSRPLGPATDLLNVLDVRLREALRQSHATEVDALVLSTSTSGDTRGNALVARRARQWASHHRLPVLVAVTDGAGPGVVQAMASLRAQGRRHIAVGSFFIAGDEGFSTQREAAIAAGAEAVSAPMGGHEFILDLVMARYAYAAMELLDAATTAQEPQEPAEIPLDAISL
ncbi:sirohydrochlorin chelatase [Luteococcus peritonei]|uniref:Sirohydrochlorin chelatase n=1 Tax=Luteococcus peritonei TaxID=88874 RepID=A0ABW4RVM6_9ACTN